MRVAIEVAREAVARGQTPFGACIVGADGREVVRAHNVVWETTDITAHAEVTVEHAGAAVVAAGVAAAIARVVSQIQGAANPRKAISRAPARLRTKSANSTHK